MSNNKDKACTMVIQYPGRDKPSQVINTVRELETWAYTLAPINPCPGSLPSAFPRLHAYVYYKRYKALAEDLAEKIHNINSAEAAV